MKIDASRDKCSWSQTLGLSLPTTSLYGKQRDSDCASSDGIARSTTASIVMEVRLGIIEECAKWQILSIATVKPNHCFLKFGMIYFLIQNISKQRSRSSQYLLREGLYCRYLIWLPHACSHVRDSPCSHDVPCMPLPSPICRNLHLSSSCFPTSGLSSLLAICPSLYSDSGKV